jgi:hypothetical protein
MYGIARAAACMAVAALGCGGSEGEHAEHAPAHPEIPGAVQKLPGCRWSVWLPEGAVRIPRMSGFVVPDHGIVVVLSDANVPPEEFEEYVGGMIGQLRTGSELHDMPTTHQGQPARRVTFRGAQNGEALFVSNGTAVGSVHVSSEEPADPALVAQILTSLTLEPGASFDPASTLGISLDPVEGLTPVLKIAGVLTWVEAGVQPPLPPGTPILVLAYLPYPQGEPLTEPQMAEAMRGLVGDFNVDVAQAHTASPTVAGARAHELVGPGSSEGHPLVVYGLLAPVDTGVFAATGSVAPERADEWIARYRRLIGSIRLTP